MSPRLTLLKNAASNIIRGGASSLVALGLPYFLTRALAPEQYGVWVLALQLGAYVNYLDAGIQTAIGRFVAQTIETNDADRRNQILSSATLLLLAAMCAGFALIGAVALLLPHLYPSMPAESASELRICLALVGGSLAVGLPASVYTGILIGYQRNEIPAIAIGASKLVGGVGVAFAAIHLHSLVSLAVITAGFNLLSYVAQALITRKIVPGIRFGLRLVTRPVMKELVSYCSTLSTWSVGMLLVGGLDLTLVGVVDYPHLGAYAIANTLVLLLAGLNNSVFSAMLAPMARMHARNDSQQLAKLVLRSTRFAILLNGLAAMPLLFFGRTVLHYWVAAKYVDATIPILTILVIANAIRTVFNPYSVAVISTGQQRVIIVSPLIEGSVNLLASIAAGYLWGARGIAIGTLVGSIVGVVWCACYAVPRTTEIRITVQNFALWGLLQPLILLVPICLAAWALSAPREMTTLPVVVAAIGVTVCASCYLVRAASPSPIYRIRKHLEG